MYSNDVCNSVQLKTHSNAIGPMVNKTTFWLGDHFYRIINDAGLNTEICLNECIFALFNQSDSSSGGPNFDIYLAFNRVVNGRSDRNGYGTCSARISWQCPTTGEGINVCFSRALRRFQQSFSHIATVCEGIV